MVVMVGLGVVAVAVRREDRGFTLVGEAPDWLSRGTRRLNGVGRRDLDPELLRPAGELVLRARAAASRGHPHHSC